MTNQDDESQKIIFSMHKVGRGHPPKKQVLKGISLGFYYGAKRCQKKRSFFLNRVLANRQVPGL